MKRIELFFATLAICILANVVAARATRIYLDPSSVVDTSLSPGDTFTVDVKVDDVTDMGGYDIQLSYDTSVLNITGNVHTYPSGFSELKNEVDEDAGTYWLAAADFFGTSPFSGSTSLATLTFTITDDGWSNLDIYETSIPDKNNNPISHDVEDGYFSNAVITTTTVPATTTTVRSGGGGGGGTTSTVPEETTTTVPVTTTTTLPEETTTTLPPKTTTTVTEEETELPTGRFQLIDSNLPYIVLVIIVLVIIIILIKVRS